MLVNYISVNLGKKRNTEISRWLLIIVQWFVDVKLNISVICLFSFLSSHDVQ